NVQALARFLQGELGSHPPPLASAPEAFVRAEPAPAPMPAVRREAPPVAATSPVATAASPAPRTPTRMPTSDGIVLQRRSHAARALTQARPAAGTQRNDEKIAIIGMSGRYPGADDLDQLWRNLAQGRNSIREIPPERWDVDAYYDPTPGKPGKVYSKWLGMLD